MKNLIVAAFVSSLTMIGGRCSAPIPGKPAPDFTLADVTLSALNRDKPVVLFLSKFT